MFTYDEALTLAFRREFPVMSLAEIKRMVEVAKNVKQPTPADYPAGTVARDKTGGVWIKTDGAEGDDDPDAWVRFLGNSPAFGVEFASNKDFPIGGVITTVEVS